LSSSDKKNKQYEKILLFPLPVRIFHWILVVSLSAAIISGLEISFAYPLTDMRIIRLIHVSSGLIALSVVIYRLGYALISGDYKNFSINMEDIRTLPDLVRYYLFLKSDTPPLRTKYNIGQKMVFLSWLFAIIFLAFAGIMLLNSFFIAKGTGFAFICGRILPQHLRMCKYYLTIYMVITIMLHIYLALTSDIAKAQAMFTGWVRKKPKK